MAGVTTYTCNKCRPVDTEIIEAYLILTNTSTAVSQQEAGRVAAENARVLAEQGRTQQFAEDHGVAQEDHRIASGDHTLAVADHGTASDDHVLAVADHGTASDDHTASTSATTRANNAAAAAEHMVDIHQGPPGPAGKAPVVGANGNWWTWDDETEAYVDRGEQAQGPEGDPGATPDISIGTVTTGAAGSPAAASMTGTAESPVLNLTIPQGIQGNTGSSVDYPFELVNNETTDDATKAHSAAGAKRLKDEISQLETDLNEYKREFSPAPSENYYGDYTINSSGTMTASVNGKVYRFPISAGDVFSMYGKGSVSYAALSFSTNATPASVTMIMMHSGSYGYFTYKAQESGYIFALAEKNTTIRILHVTGKTELEKFGVDKFSYGKNVLQPIVGSSVSDTDIWGAGYLSSTGGVTAGTGYHYTIDYIPVLPGDYLSRIPFFSNSRLCYYNKFKSFLGALSTGNTTSSIARTIPSGAAFVRISLDGNDTSTLSMVFQDEGKDVPTISDVLKEIPQSEGFDNNLINEFDKIKDAGWTVKQTYGGANTPVTEQTYGLPNVMYYIPIDASARVIHIKVDFKLANGFLPFVSSSTNQMVLTVKSYLSYAFAIRQQDALYMSQNGLITRRQFLIARQGNNITDLTIGAGEYDGFIGEPAYIIAYKGDDYATASGYTINLTSTAITVKNGSTTLETISIDTDELLESVISKINTNSNYLTAKAVEVAGLKYTDCICVSDIPLCTSSSTKPYVVRSKIDRKWHSLEILIDYDKLMSWTNIDGVTLKRAITNNTGNKIILGEQVSESVGMCQYAFRNLHVGYSYEDAEIITYPNNVSGTVERLISNTNPYLMVFEGHGIEDKTNTEGTANDMDATTDRLRTVFDYMRGKGYVPVSWKQVKDWRLNGAKLPKRCYTLMFDDFRIENYMDMKLREPFVQFGVKPGLAIITGQNGQTRSRSEEVTIDGQTWTLGECFDAIIKGEWYPCSHTKSHTTLNTVSYGEFLDFVKDCSYSCDKLGIYDDILVYPEGKYNTGQIELMSCKGGMALGVQVAINGYNCILRNRFLILRNEIGQRKALADVLAQIV